MIDLFITVKNKISCIQLPKSHSTPTQLCSLFQHKSHFRNKFRLIPSTVLTSQKAQLRENNICK